MESNPFVFEFLYKPIITFQMICHQQDLPKLTPLTFLPGDTLTTHIPPTISFASVSSYVCELLLFAYLTRKYVINKTSAIVMSY